MTDADRHFAALSADVQAYNDVTIHCLTAPRSQDSFREAVSAHPQWNADRATADVWEALYHGYRQHFDAYLHDPEALNFRDQRKRNQTKAQQRQQTRRGR